MTSGAPSFNGNNLLSVMENNNVVAALSATDDVDSVGNGLTFSLAGGNDSALFVIDPATGVLSFVGAPDYENASDADHNNVYELVARVTDSQGQYSETAFAVQVTDQANLQIIMTSGQSLSVGTSYFNATLSPTPQYPSNVLGLNFTNVAANVGWGSKTVNPAAFNGFSPLKETGSETHVSGMMNMLNYEYQANGLTAPTFVHFNNGAGGKSVLQLLTSQSDIYASTAEGIQAEQTGNIFAVDKQDGTYDFYIKTATGALFYNNDTGVMPFFDNLVTQLQLTVDYGRSHGYEISSDIVLNWIQGQNDTYIDTTAAAQAGFGYAYALGQMFDKVEAAAQQIIGSNADVLGVVSQIKGFGNKSVPIEQLSYILSNPNVVLGATEYQFEAEFPSRPGADNVHLSAEGYYMMGQTIGGKMFDLLTGNENTPIVMNQVQQISATSVLVHFSGVNTYLVNDPSVFRAANYIDPPPTMGFGAYNATGSSVMKGLNVTNATIIDADTVQVDFSAPLTTAFRLYLGRTPYSLATSGTYTSFDGTTLRDASVHASLTPTNGNVTLSDPYIYEYAPVQYYTINPNKAPVFTSAASVSAAENSPFSVDLDVTDDFSLEGNGITYAISGGTDAALFGIDATTGVLSFLTQQNFESPADSNHDNAYVVNVSATDALGAVSSFTQTVTVTNVNEAPTSIADPGFSVSDSAANGSVVGVIQATDPDAGDTLNYALLDNFGGAFGINASTGAVTVADASLVASYTGQTLVLPVAVTDLGGLGLQGSVHVNVVTAPPQNPLITGTSGNDTLAGTFMDDTIFGLAGDDQLNGDLGNDVLNGGLGNDRFTGGAGVDTLTYDDATAAIKINLSILGKAQATVGAGSDILVDQIENVTGSNYNDVLTGNGLDNLMYGLNGNDQINGGVGADTMIGGLGNDTYTVDNVNDQVIENAGGGTDSVKTSLDYTLGANIERLFQSGTTNSSGTGNSLVNTLTGNSGDNLLSGLGGKDVLSGGAGHDTLNGGVGADNLTGGTGNDIFLFDVLETSTNKDTIVDFTSGEDHIAFTRSAFAAFSGSPAGAIDPIELVMGTAATNANEHLIYNGSTGALYYDVDGAGGAAQVQIALLSNHPIALTSNDIILM